MFGKSAGDESDLLLIGVMPEMAEAMFTWSSFCSMCKATWSCPWSDPSSSEYKCDFLFALQ